MKDLFCGSFLDLLRENVMQALETSQSKDIGQIRILFDIMKEMLDDVDTEHKILKYFFSEKNAFVQPENTLWEPPVFRRLKRVRLLCSQQH